MEYGYVVIYVMLVVSLSDTTIAYTAVGKDQILKIIQEFSERQGNEIHFDKMAGAKTNRYNDIKKNGIDANLLNRKIVDLYTTNLTNDCERDFIRYQDELAQTLSAKWAIIMADSDGKIGSGIWDGHTIFEGSYPECSGVQEPERPLVTYPIRGKYCLGTSYTYNFLDDTIYIRGKGICIPDTCTDDDAKILLVKVYDFVLDINPLLFVNCVEDKELNAEAIISIVILSLLGLMVFIGTFYDWVCRRKQCKISQQNDVAGSEVTAGGKIEEIELPNKTSNSSDATISQPAVVNLHEDLRRDSRDRSSHDLPHHGAENKPPKPGWAEKILKTFSMYTTIPVILSAQMPKGVYPCLNGLRFISIMYVVLGHTYRLGPVGPNWPENMYAFIDDALADWKYFKLINIDVVVDTFFILSAFLVTMSFLRKLKKTKGKPTVVGMALHYFNRWWRLTPTYMIILLAYTNLYHYFGKGPFMRDYTADIDGCATTWWKNLLYVNNFWPVDADWCMGWTWYLAVDMQMFIIAPLFIVVFYWNKIAGSIFIGLGFSGGLIANIVLYHQLYTQKEGDEDPVSEFNDIIIVTWTRCCTYFQGMMLAYIFYVTGAPRVKMPKLVVALGWAVTVCLWLIVSYIAYLASCSGSVCGPWTIPGRVAWESLKRPIWGIVICWTIWACCTGYGGFLNTFLSWNFFYPLAKISYLVYLIHPFFTYLFFDGSPTQFFFTTYFVVYIFFGHLLVSHLMAFVLSVFVSGPLIGIAAVFLPTKK